VKDLREVGLMRAVFDALQLCCKARLWYDMSVVCLSVCLYVTDVLWLSVDFRGNFLHERLASPVSMVSANKIWGM